MLAQAIVERGMLEGIANGLTRVKYVIEAQIGDGNAKWLVVAAVLLLVAWAMRRR